MMMKNHEEPIEINYNPNWSYIPNQPDRIFICLGSGKTTVLLNLIKHQRPHIEKVYLYVENPFESKYQLRINKREKVGIKELKNSKSLIDYTFFSL